MNYLQHLAILLTLTISVNASADLGWVGQFNNLQCTGPAIFEPASGTNNVYDLQAGGCVTFNPTLDTIGIFWGSNGQQFGSGEVDASFRQLFMYKDDNCSQSSGWTVKRPASWANGGPRACFSMATFGGPYKSISMYPTNNNVKSNSVPQR